MYKDRKLAEAEYFYSQMLSPQPQQSQDNFKFNVNAFLAAVRSTLRYVRKEAITDSRGKAWYETAVDQQSIKHFKDKHDFDIELSDRIGLGLVEREEVEIFEGGELAGQRRRSDMPPEQSAAEEEPQRPTVSFVYLFPEGSDVIGLCRAYLDAVKALVADGRSRGFLS